MNNKIRIYDLARKLNKSNKELIAVLKQLDIPVKSHSSSIDEDTARIVENIINESAQPSVKSQPSPEKKSEKKPEK
ncbi:MAG: translation initiation factor IF-2 N-terminal domain-containing protein, partial [Synergistaceae bacterium]|nr:translation initiation factor IF-2 N-terminal domain-containing protein [Synergistaceae bacterium]